jgi:hypothetical protein
LKKLSDDVKKKMSNSHKGIIGESANNVGYYIIITPTGEEIIFCGDFVKKCKELGIKTPQFLKNVAKGLRESYKGWNCIILTKEQYFKKKEELL